MVKPIINRKFTLVNKVHSTAAAAPAVKKAEATTSVSAAVGHGVVVGVPLGMSAAGLRPVCRVEVMSQTRHVTFLSSTGVLSSNNVCDPTGIATDALGVDSWNSRFAGFQQYRVRSTRWILVPLRTLVGTTTSSQAGGHVGVWVQDSPQAGSPNQTTFQQANRKFVLINQERIESIAYTTNEPQDLNLSDIFLPPTHITGATLVQGQHCLQIYGDDTLTGIVGISSAAGYVPMFSITAVYDIEFFGVGGI